MVRRFLGELRWIIQSQVAIHLVGADVMEPHIILARRFKQAECASTFVFTNGSGFAIELSLCDSAA